MRLCQCSHVLPTQDAPPLLYHPLWGEYSHTHMCVCFTDVDVVRVQQGQCAHNMCFPVVAQSNHKCAAPFSTVRPICTFAPSDSYRHHVCAIMHVTNHVCVTPYTSIHQRLRKIIITIIMNNGHYVVYITYSIEQYKLSTTRSADHVDQHRQRSQQ